MDIEEVEIEKAENMQIVIGHAGFIKTVEDIYEAMITSVPGIKFGIAFAEASGKRLIRHTGNEAKLEELAARNLFKINAGHTFLILFENAYPINIMKHLRDVDEITSVYVATANPVSAIVANASNGRVVIGIADGSNALGIENDNDKEERHKLLRDFGYKQ